MYGQLVLSCTTGVCRSTGEISTTHVSPAAAIWLQTMMPLTAGDTVELAGMFPDRRLLFRRRSHVLPELQDWQSGGLKIR